MAIGVQEFFTIGFCSEAVRAERARDERAHEERKAATQRANELGAKVDAVLKELRHATKKSGWGQLTQ